MNTRSLLVPFLVLAYCASVVAGPADANAPRRFLTPPEVVKIVEQSEVMYQIIIGMKSLADVNPANTTDKLFPLSVRPIECPWRLEKEDGSTEIIEFPFTPAAWKLIDEAETYFRSRQFPQAIRSCQKVVDQFPDCYLAYAHLGDCYYQMKLYDRALEYFDIAIGLNPWDHRTFVYRADALINLGRPDEAKAAYIHSLSLNPRYWLALANLQHLADQLGVEVRKDLFQPQAFVRPENDEIAVYVSDRQPIEFWLAYALVKAIWLGEPWHRQEMIGDSTYKWSSVEETEALLNLIAIYRSSKQDGRVRPDPKLDLLETIVDAGDLVNFIYYEIASRMCPHFTLTLTEEARQSLREFIAKYVVVAMPKHPVEEGNQRVAAATAPAGRPDRQARAHQ